MAGRGATTFQKRQKELQRKERQQQKFEKRLERKKNASADNPATLPDPPEESLSEASPQLKDS
jgi:hypothetical protein